MRMKTNISDAQLLIHYSFDEYLWNDDFNRNDDGAEPADEQLPASNAGLHAARWVQTLLPVQIRRWLHNDGDDDYIYDDGNHEEVMAMMVMVSKCTPLLWYKLFFPYK